MDIFIYIVTSILVIVGAIGTVLPMLPGVILIFIGVLIFSLYTNFQQISYLSFGIIAALTLVSLSIDYLSGVIGAKFSGASTWGTAGAILGALVGVSAFGFVGLLLAPAFFVLIFELISNRSLSRSSKSASYTLVSTLVGLIINFVIAFAMILIFLGSIFI